MPAATKCYHIDIEWYLVNLAIIQTSDDWLSFEKTSVKFELKYDNFHSRKLIWKCILQNVSLFSQPQCFNIDCQINWIEYHKNN